MPDPQTPPRSLASSRGTKVAPPMTPTALSINDLRNNIVSKDKELTQLKKDNRNLERDLAKIEKSMQKLISERDTANSRSESLQERLTQSEQAQKNLKKQKVSLIKHQKSSDRDLKRLEEIANKENNEKALSAEIADKENKIKDLGATVSNQEKELVTLRRSNLGLEKRVESLTLKLKEANEKSESETLTSTRELLFAAEARVKELESENKALAKVQLLKTKAIEDLVTKKEVQKDNLMSMHDLENDLVFKNNKIKELEHSLKVVEQDSKRKEQRILELEGREVDSVGWIDEKRYLEADIEKRKEANKIHEMTIKAQNARINTLLGRLKVLADCVSDSKGTKQFDKVDLSDRVDPNASVDSPPEDSVSPKLYQALEKDVTVLRASLKDMERELGERSAIVESLSKQVDIEQRAKTSQEKKLQREKSEILKNIASP